MFQKLAEANGEPGDFDCNFFGWNDGPRYDLIYIHAFIMIRRNLHGAGCF